jgi:hypothetical protein
MARTLGNYS